MTLHAVVAYIKYRLQAKGRHGTHSPFIYKLVDECLLVCDGHSLEEKLRTYFANDTVTWLDDAAPEQWNDLTEAALKERAVIIIPNIHSTAKNTICWNRLITMPNLMMSIDLFDGGLLLSRNEFKHKQHFVLKYC